MRPRRSRSRSRQLSGTVVDTERPHSLVHDAQIQSSREDDYPAPLIDCLEFDLTRLDSSEDEPPIRSEAGRNVVPRLADIEDISSTVLHKDVGHDEFTPVSMRRSSQRAGFSPIKSWTIQPIRPSDGQWKPERSKVGVDQRGGTSMPENIPEEWESSGESDGEEVTQVDVDHRTVNGDEDQSEISEDPEHEDDEAEATPELLLVPPTQKHVERIRQFGLRQSGGGFPGPSSGHENSSHVHQRSVQGCSESGSGRDQKRPRDGERRGVDQRLEIVSPAAPDAAVPTTERWLHSTILAQVGVAHARRQCVLFGPFASS